MSWLEVALFWGLFASTFLVQVRLPLLAIGANNLAVPVFAILLAWRARASIEPAWHAYRNLLRTTALVYVWVWVSSLNGVLPAHSVHFTVRYTAYLVVGFSFLLLLHRRSALRPAQRTVYCILAALAGIGILEHWWPWFPFVALRGQLITYPRVSSFFLWPNQFGVLMAIGIALGKTLQHGGDIRPGQFRAALVPFLVALAFSGSRNGWFVLAALLLVLAIVRVIAIGQLVLISAAFAFILLILPVSMARLGLATNSTFLLFAAPEAATRDVSGMNSPAQTLAQRLLLWGGALGAIRQHPLTGIGLEAFADTTGVALLKYRGFNTHDLFLNVATEQGLIGLALFCLWLWVLFRSGDPHDWTTAVPLLGIGLGQIFDCFVYDYAFMSFSFFFVAAYASVSLPSCPTVRELSEGSSQTGTTRDNPPDAEP